MLALKSFLEDVYLARKFTLKRNSVDNLRRTVKVFDRFCGGATLADLSESALLAFLAERYKVRKPNTVQRDRSNLLTLWRYAHRWGYKAEPAPNVETVTVPWSIPSAFTVEEVRSILKTCRSLQGKLKEHSIRRKDWWESLVLFLYDTGGRLNAALSLKTDSLDLPACRAVLESTSSKTVKAQVVQFSGQTGAAIRQHLTDRELVWPWPYRRETLWRHFRRIVCEAGVRVEQGQAFHKLRRAHATQTCAAIGLDAAAKALGHASSEITKRYIDQRQLGPCNQVDCLPRP